MQRILIVEDQRSIAHLWGRAYQKLNYAVDIVHTQYEAIKILNQSPLPDLLITDHMLVDGSGLHVIDHLATIDSEHYTRVFLVTADPVEFLPRIPGRVDEFMQKPVLLRVLLETTDKYLGAASSS